jgi:hypothetical protein
MMYFYIEPKGRLGNALFRYCITRLFTIVYGHKELSECKVDLLSLFNISDELFVQFFSEMSPQNQGLLERTPPLLFHGFYQHDHQITTMKAQLRDYILSHPNEVIKDDRGETFQSSFILSPLVSPPYESLVHLRLEDFISHNLVMDPRCILPILQILPKPIYLLVKEPSTPLEKKYISYLQSHVQCEVLSGDVITDYNRMRNAKYLVCSRSTLSWMAAFWNDVHKVIFMPQQKYKCTHETFQYPSQNVLTYVWNTLSKEDCEQLFL